MTVFLLLFLSHLATTAAGLRLHRRLCAGRSFQFPRTIGIAVQDPVFRALLLLGIILPYIVALVLNTLVFKLDYASGRYTWTLALHTSLSILYYQASLRAASKQKRS